MRKYLSILVSLCLASILLAGAQSLPDTLLQTRSHLIKEYNLLSDSLIKSGNSEIQSMTTSFDKLIESDNTIIEKYIPELIRELEDLNEQMEELERINTEQDNKLIEYEDFRIPVLVVVGLLLLLFILLLVLFTSKTLKLKKIRFKIENYEASYEENKALIENLTKENSALKIKETELKKQIEKLILENDTKIKLLKSDLDNTLNESKLLQKRMTELTEDFGKEQETRKLSEDESMQLKEKNFSLEQQLSDAKNIIEKETMTRKHIEQELRQLLDQLKGL